MKMLAIVAAMVMLGGDPPQSSQTVREMMAAYDASMAKDPCLRREGSAWAQLRWSQCLKFGRPQRMHGVWFWGFEESGFVPNVRRVRLVRNLFDKQGMPEFTTYLEIDLPAALRRIKVPQSHGCTQAIAIDFIGRRSVKRGAYYTGTNDAVIVVDRVIGGRFLGVVKSVGPPGWEKRKC